jgi:putative DNA primase/helicase
MKEVSQSRASPSAKDLVPPPLWKPLNEEQSDRPVESTNSSTSVTPDISVVGVDDGSKVPHHADEKHDEELVAAMEFVKGLLHRARDDCGAPFEPKAIMALKVIQLKDHANYQRNRAELKKANKDISLAHLDMILRGKTTEKNFANTHHGYATNVLKSLTVEEYPPVGHEGSLYVVNPAENIWVQCKIEMLIRKITEKHDGWENCERSADYRGIALHAIDLASSDTYFSSAAPVGLACPGGFIQIKENEIVMEPLSPAHRQRVKIDVTPEPCETPLFNRFLHETFESDIPGDEEQQLILVQEIAGAIMFGLMAKHQKAVLFYEPYGRAGKGTLERMLRELVPQSFITCVSPFKWGEEYYLASLAGARLNVVGELQGSKPIPAAAFKTVTGGDLLNGRHPNHRPISFRNEAAHLFMSNDLINTVDHSEAFFTRWLLVSFPNSRIKSGLPIDPDLADRIINNELPGIAHWAMIGAQRLMANGSFSISSAHNRLMEKWRRSSSSLEEFIYECCTLESGSTVRRAVFYQEYKSWCGENGKQHPFSKSKVKDLLENNISLKIHFSTLDGNEIFRGVRLKKT